jgi:hypothetical protein
VEKTMLLSEVLQEMKKLTDGKKSVPFNLAIRTFNRYNKNGGKYVLYNLKWNNVVNVFRN